MKMQWELRSITKKAYEPPAKVEHVCNTWFIGYYLKDFCKFIHHGQNFYIFLCWLRSYSSFKLPHFLFTFSWLNTTMMENRTLLSSSDLDGFDKVKDVVITCALL